MQFNKWFSKKKIQLIRTFMLGICGIVLSISVVVAQEISVEVVLSPKIDLVLTTGISDLDLSHFEKDVVASLETLGVNTQNTDMVEISAIETTSASLESTNVDFVSVVNSWKTVGADTWSATPQGEIYSKTPGGSSKPAWWGTGIINPDGFDIDDLKAEFTLVNGGALNEGFCFNVTQNEDGSLNGYFISYSNHNNTTRALFRFDHYTLDQGFDKGINNLMWCYNRNGWDVGKRHVVGNDSFTSLATWTDSGKNINYEVTYKDGKIVVKDNGSVVANVTDRTYPKGTYGFWGNNCEMAAFSYTSNLKITATKTVSKDYAQVLLEPKWREDAAHFVVNVENPINESLKNPEALARTLADNIHFIQWGSDVNKASAEDFIAKNDNNGAFYSGQSSDYQQTVENTARYIKMIVDRMQQANAQYVLVGENAELVVSPESVKNNAVSSLFPTGRWLIHHDPKFFDNDEGQSPLTEVFQKDLLCAFDKPGKYEILFDNEKVKEVYVHRKPVADFNIGIQDGNVTLTSSSYDLDSNEDKGYGKGIKSEEWYYKKDSETEWTSGKLSRLTANEVYIIKLVVSDNQGVSEETIKYVGIGAPVANFGLENNLISTADSLKVQDYSYDPQGYNLTKYEWVLKKGNTVVGTYTSAQFPTLDFSSATLGEGDYSLSLKVTNTANDESGVFIQTFKVETARYNNRFLHYATGFKNKEGNTDDGNRFLMQTTYVSQTFGTSFTPINHTLAIPNGFYLEKKYNLDDQEYDVNTSVEQPGKVLELAYQYSPYVYTIDYDLDGGTLEKENISSYTVLYGATLNKPVKKYYTFLGWYDEAGNKYEGINEGATANFTNTADMYSQLARRTTGNLKLTAKWEHHEYQVTGTKYGHGTISQGGIVGEGEDATITWIPDEGYKVLRVIVDDIVRDDLLNKGAGNTITFNNVYDNHTVRVDFEKIDNGNKEEEEEKNYYTILTEQKGGSKEATISNSKTLLKGSDYKVEWKPGATDEVESITIDGMDYPKDKRSVEFKQISNDHKVVIVYKSNEEKSSTETDGYYRVNVQSQNGDSKKIDTQVSKSAVVNLAEDYTLTWTAKNGYEVDVIWIDRGTSHEIALSEAQIRAGSYEIQNIEKDHDVVVIFKKENEHPDDKKQVQIKTELVGGPGEITESAVLNAGEDYLVEWDAVVKTTEDVKDPEYAVYKVSKVILNGKTIEAEDSIELNHIESNQTVKVVMEPVLHQVETVLIGKGTIDPSVTLYDGQNYTVKAIPESGWVIKAVYVDDEIKYDQTNEHTLSDTEVDVDVNNQDKVVNVQINGITQNHKIYVELMKEDGTPVDTSHYLNVTGRVVGGPGVFNGSGQYESGSQTVLKWDIAKGYEVERVTVKVNGVQRNDLVNKKNELELLDIQDNYDVTVTLKKSNNKLEEEEVEKKVWAVTTKITGGEGEITPTNHNLVDGSDWKVEWEFDTNRFVIKEVRIDGMIDDSYMDQKQIAFKKLSENHSVEIILAVKGSSQEPDKDKKEQYLISTRRTLGGKIDPSQSVDAGKNRTVRWEAAEGYVVVSVSVDGMTRKDLIEKGFIEFYNINRDHLVEVIFVKEGELKPNVNELYSITTGIKAGEGYIDGSVYVEKGTEQQIKWSAAKGYEVKTVVIDGTVRDDLKDETEYTFKNIKQNHTIFVLFQKEKEGMGSGEETESKKDMFFIQTSQEGKGSISPSVIVSKGESYIVKWEAAEGYVVSRVEIDGVIYPELIKANSIELKDIRTDHQINVIFDRIDGVVVKPEDIVHITTKVSGGYGQISGSFTAEKGENVTIDWKPKEGYVVYKVYVNGKEVSYNSNQLVIEKVDEDYVVEVVFIDEKNLPKPTEPEKPTVTTKPEKPKDPIQTNVLSEDKNPTKTGDNIQIAVYFILMLSSLLGVAYCYKNKVKKG